MVDFLGDKRFSFSMLRRIPKKMFHSTFVTIRDSKHVLSIWSTVFTGQYTPCTCVRPIHSISKNGVTIESIANVGRQIADVTQTKHIVTGSTALSRFISICLLSHYMKDAVLRLSELIWPKPNGRQVLSEWYSNAYNLLAIQVELHLCDFMCIQP